MGFSLNLIFIGVRGLGLYLIIGDKIKMLEINDFRFILKSNL